MKPTPIPRHVSVLRILVAIVASGLGLYVALWPVSSATNLLVNPGFESGTANWLKATLSGRSVVNTVSHSGVLSHQQVVSNQYMRLVYQDGGATPGVQYQVSGWINTTGINGGGAKIQILWLNATGLPETFYLTTSQILRTDAVGAPITGTTPWAQVSGTFTAPAGTAAVRMELITNIEPDNTGRAWFDDLSIDGGTPDTTAPAVNLTSPIDGSTVSGTSVVVSANASDNVAVSGVQFKLNGNNLGAEDTTSPYSVNWDTTQVPNGSYTLTALARDAAGNTTTSSGATVSVANADVTPPTVPTGLSASPVSTTQINLSWNASTDNVGVTGYVVVRNGNSIATPVTTTYQDTNLSPSTTYSYATAARDAAGNQSALSATVQATTNAVPDTIAPTVAITTPASGSSVAGTSVAVSADATDNVAVSGVQFKLNGNNLGAEDTTSPYSVNWDTTQVPNGSYTLTALARDAAGNTTTSSGTAVSVNSNLPTATNLLVDPGLENSDPAWKKTALGGRSIVTTQFHSGARSQQMLVSNQFGREVYQRITVTPNASYYISGWIMTSGVNGTGAQLKVVWLNAAGVTADPLPASAIIRTDVYGGITGTLPSWTQVTGNNTAPAGAVEARFYLFTNIDPDSSGTAWFDDLTVMGSSAQDTTPPTAHIVTPLAGSTLSNTATVSVQANDNVGVAKVQLEVDGILIGQPDITAPYILPFDITGLANGSHSVRALATDSSNNSGSSAPLNYLADNTNRPSFVMILTDDQRSDTMQYMPITSARLGVDSVIFSNGFVSTALCCPSRSSILTGRYAHNTGILFTSPPNGGAISFNDTSTLPVWLQATGYKTSLIGKYLNGNKLISPRVPPGWSNWQVFDDDSLNPYFNYDMNENGTIVHYANGVNDYSTDVLASKSVAFINNTPSNQPLFLMVAPFASHFPYTPAPQDSGSYSNLALWRPPSYNEADVNDKPAWIQQTPLLSPSQIASSDLVRQQQIESLQAVDRMVGQIMDALAQTGRLPNTYFIFTSDNGFAWGEHRIIEDKLCLYDECHRVPFWIKGPNLTPRTENKFIQNIDLAPTMADWAGVGIPSPVNGMSVKNLLLNPQSPWRTEILLEGWGHFAAQTSIRGYSAVRDDRYVYGEYPNGNREFYDFLVDPYQLVNKVNDPAYASIIPGLQARLNVLKNQ